MYSLENPSTSAHPTELGMVSLESLASEDIYRPCDLTQGHKGTLAEFRNGFWRHPY